MVEQKFELPLPVRGSLVILSCLLNTGAIKEKVPHLNNHAIQYLPLCITESVSDYFSECQSEK